MTDRQIVLEFPAGLSARRCGLLVEVAARNNAVHGANLLGIVLSGSVGRGVATGRSDLDVFVVLADSSGEPAPCRSAAVDEVPVTLSDLETVPAFGTKGWWFRWSFAWAPVLLDRTDGRLPAALRRQATVTPDEAQSVLVAHDRLDGWLNYAYRAVKSHRDGRGLECRLDAAESIPWLLDVIFTLAGRVRPYHTYLPWELREHPLPHWPADELLALLAATLDGQPAATRTAFQRVEALCAAWDAERAAPVLVPIINAWGDDLRLLKR